MEEKIVIAIASGRGEVSIDFMTTVIDMILETKKKYPNIAIATLICKQTYIHKARQILADSFLETNADRMLCIDDDNIPQSDSLIKLLEHDLPIVSGLYFKRRAPFEPIIMMKRAGGEGSERRPDLWREGIDEKPFAVHSTGFGFILIKRGVLEKMKELNMPLFDMRGGVGEDIWFCIQAAGAGFEIVIDPKCEVGHLGDRRMITGKDYREYYKENIQNRIDKAEKVQGWMTKEELTYLANEAINCDNVAEVGSWKGRSSIVLSLSQKLWCIDKFDGILEGKAVETQEITGTDFLKQFQYNTREFENIRVIKGDSVEMSKEFKDAVLDFILIDGNHTYESCKADLEAYWDKIRIGGKIALHDYCAGWPGVVKAVTEFMQVHLPVATGRNVPNTTLFEIVKL